MNTATSQKYAARLNELEALHHELATGKRPGDGGVVVGLLLEAAGDVLRRKSALNVASTDVIKQLAAITEQGLKSWGDGVQVADLTARLKRAAAQAVESALPDSPEDGAAMAQWAAQDLQARDRLESAVVALENLGRPDAKELASRIRSALQQVDRTCRAMVASFTALNQTRRTEAALLDTEFRGAAWWYSERTGIEDDSLVSLLGGETRGSMPDEVRGADRAGPGEAGQGRRFR